MLAPKCPIFNGRPTFANPACLKKAQSEIPCLYEIPHDQSDPANSLVPDREETLTLERESREKLNKDLVKHYDYTKLNSLYENFKPPTQEYQIQLAHANEVKHSKDRFRAPTALDMEVLIKTCLMPLVLKTQNDSFAFVHELKQEMHDDLRKEKLAMAGNGGYRNNGGGGGPSGYKWVPKTKTKWVPKAKNENVKKRVSFAIDNASRITNVLKLTNSLGSNLSNVPSSYSSLEDCLTHPIHLSKAKRSSLKTKVVPSLKGRLNLLHIDLCGPMRVASKNGKKYILVIVDDYSRYTWTLFLRSKDETPKVLKDFLIMIQWNLQALVISVRTDRGIEFSNKTLYAFFKEEGIDHQTSTLRTPEQKGVVER
ncbi:retrovirus-related pol polyprotein from transposon TNT 1-94 [Tanacetum coccineum]|uniref:Retrovirus-related pol polyprotein from transposon TNT 1-94 n=1 Tax=Tanacetum coccineum TaxID=301880 RepID=A0ABQ4WDP4_9ASTR